MLSAEAALDADDDVILVRPETNPKDVAGMSASVGVLTTKGGLVSHAAVVARGWGIPAVVGAHDLQPGVTVRAGDLITIDGSSGKVWRGEVAAGGGDLEAELPGAGPARGLGARLATRRRRSARGRASPAGPRAAPSRRRGSEPDSGLASASSSPPRNASSARSNRPW